MPDSRRRWAGRDLHVPLQDSARAVLTLPRVPGLHRFALVIAVGVLVATLAVALPADWYLSCRDQQGNELGGIDCFQFDTAPTTDAAPARWIGFGPLVITGALAAMTILAIAGSWAWRAADNVPRATGLFFALVVAPLIGAGALVALTLAGAGAAALSGLWIAPLAMFLRARARDMSTVRVSALAATSLIALFTAITVLVIGVSVAYGHTTQGCA